MAYASRGSVRGYQRGPVEEVADFAQAIDLNEGVPDGTLAEADRVRFRLYAHLSLLLDRLPDPADWAQAKSQRMAVFLEQMPVTAAEQSHAPDLYQQFALFHARWLAWCVRAGHLDLIPEILAIVQGRELAAEVLDQINLEDPDTPQAVRAFHALRLELRKLNARIEAVISGGKAAGPEQPGGGMRADGAQQRPWDAKAYARLRDAHAQLIERMSLLREAAAREPGYEYLQLPHQPLTLPALQSGLAEREVLLLLIDPPEGAPGVLLIGQRGAPRWQAVPALPALAATVQAFDDGVGRGRAGGYRRGWRAEDDDADAARQALLAALRRQLPETLGDAGARLFDALAQPTRFWAALREAMTACLQGVLDTPPAAIDHLIVIPNGSLHQLPVEAGAAGPWRLSRFPGLAFFGQRRGLYGPRRVADTPGDYALGVRGFAGELDDIPLAEAEAQVLERLYRKHGRPVDHPSDYPHRAAAAELLHIACHGGADPEHPQRVALFIARPDKVPGATGHVLNQDAIITSRSALTEVFFSACLAGQTVEGLSPARRPGWSAPASGATPAAWRVPW